MKHTDILSADLEGVAMAFDENAWNRCQICGVQDKPLTWHHIDNWTDFLHINYGTNIIRCNKCEDKVDDEMRRILSEKYPKALQLEIDMLNDPEFLGTVIANYHNFGPSKEMKDWIVNNTSTENVKRILNYRCDGCGEKINGDSYKILRKDGQRFNNVSLKHIASYFDKDVKFEFCWHNKPLLPTEIDEEFHYGQSVVKNDEVIGKYKQSKYVHAKSNPVQIYCSKYCMDQLNEVEVE
jgi:hypothetical protein